jgi:hypothetical protein
MPSARFALSLDDPDEDDPPPFEPFPPEELAESDS